MDIKLTNNDKKDIIEYFIEKLLYTYNCIEYSIEFLYETPILVFHGKYQNDERKFYYTVSNKGCLFMAYNEMIETEFSDMLSDIFRDIMKNIDKFNEQSIDDKILNVNAFLRKRKIKNVLY